MNWVGFSGHLLPVIFASRYLVTAVLLIAVIPGFQRLLQLLRKYRVKEKKTSPDSAIS
jgi:hypothetical protein